MGTTNRTHERPAGLNLLRFSAVRKLIEWRGFPRVFQFATLAVFLVLVWIGFQLYPPPETNGKLFAKCNVVTLLIWGVWWPSMIYLAVLFGRSWCMVCPLELVASVTERMGQKLGWPQRNLSRWLASGALIVFLYFVIQMLVAGIHLHRVPAYTAIFLLTLLGTAAAVGFLFKNRAFCRGFCPVGVLLGTYGRGSMLAVRARSDESSEVCTGKQSCPSLLNPPKLNSSRDCLICGQCVKSCEPDTMQLLLRPPFHHADRREPLASWPITLFVMMVSGFVAYELCSEWSAAKAVFLWVPEFGASALAVPSALGWIKGVWMLLIFPMLLWCLMGGAVRLAGGAATMGESWRRLALPCAVVISAGHMAKAAAKLSTWGGFLPSAVRDPQGIETIIGLSEKISVAPSAIVPMVWVCWLGLALLASACYFAWREARLADPDGYRRRVAPIVGLALISACVVIGWSL